MRALWDAASHRPLSRSAPAMRARFEIFSQLGRGGAGDQGVHVRSLNMAPPTSTHLEARGTPTALSVLGILWQRSEQRHHRPHPSAGRFPARAAAAPPIEPRPQQPAPSRAPALLAGARSNEPWVPANLFILQVFSREQQRDRLRTRAPLRARAPPGCGPVPTPMVPL